MYRNSGSGWETFYWHLKSPAGVEVAGLLNEKLIGFWPCPAAEMEGGNGFNCLFQGHQTTAPSHTAIHRGTIYSTVRDHVQRPTLFKYQEGRWLELASFDEDYQGGFAIFEDTAYSPGIGEVIGVDLTTGERSTLDVPFRYYKDIVTTESQIVLTTSRSELLVWQRSGWFKIPIEPPARALIRPVATSDGAVYVWMGNQLLRLEGEALVPVVLLERGTFYSATAGPNGGLFLAIRDALWPDPCSGVRLVWYDGRAFHPL